MSAVLDSLRGAIKREKAEVGGSYLNGNGHNGNSVQPSEIAQPAFYVAPGFQVPDRDTQRRMGHILRALSISEGIHETPYEGMCAMEAIAFLAGLPHSNYPACTHWELAQLLNRINDELVHRSGWPKSGVGYLDVDRFKNYLPHAIGMTEPSPTYAKGLAQYEALRSEGWCAQRSSVPVLETVFAEPIQRGTW